MLIDKVKSRIIKEMDALLISPFSSKVVPPFNKYTHRSKSPGSNCMSTLFLKKLCQVVSHTMVKILNEELNPSFLNKTHIVIISEVKALITAS